MYVCIYIYIYTHYNYIYIYTPTYLPIYLNTYIHLLPPRLIMITSSYLTRLSESMQEGLEKDGVAGFGWMRPASGFRG